MSNINPYWVAPRTGHDWDDPIVLEAVDWLSSFANSAALNARLRDQEANFHSGIAQRHQGGMTACFNSDDQIAWYLVLGRSYATDRQIFDYDQICQIIPYLQKIGQNLNILRVIPGVEERARRLLSHEKSQADSGIFEFLVAAAYVRAGWTVEFVPETPGKSKQPDLHVKRPRTRWAVECKRLQKSAYEKSERIEGERIAQRFHDWCRQTRRSMIADIIFKQELKDIPTDFLVRAFQQGEDARVVVGRFFIDEIAEVRFRPVDWRSVHSVLRYDEVFFGSSRMIEILKGEYQINAEHTISVDWQPSSRNAAFADWIDRASVVTWWSDSKAAKKKRARHFKQTLNKAERQLPSDRPGIVHIGCPGHFDSDVEGQRYFYNWLYISGFQLRRSRLRWVNSHLLMPEATTDPNESWAFRETMLPFRVGTHGTRNPLPNEMIVVPQEESVAL